MARKTSTKIETQSTPQSIADELTACGTLVQLQATKSTYGDIAVKAGWKLLSQDERSRLTSICQNEPKLPLEVQPVIEEPQPEHLDAALISTVYPENAKKVDTWLERQGLVETQPTPKRSLFNISDDLQYLNDLLDEVGDDSQQQELISQLFETLGNERDRKLDSYAALISEMQARADVRKVEAKRMQELAATDENRARLLKDKLKSFFQLHDLKTIETPRYKLSLAKNGGKAPLVMDESVPATKLPEQFQKVSIDANTAVIREALEAGEVLNFAHLGERGVSLRIR